MQIIVIDHFLVVECLVIFCNVVILNYEFREVFDGFGGMLVYEVTRSLFIVVGIVIILFGFVFVLSLARVLMLVFILCVGVGLVQLVLRLILWVEVGFVGLARDEEMHDFMFYLVKFLVCFDGWFVIVLDLMLVIGGLLEFVCWFLLDRGVELLFIVVCVLVVFEGIERMRNLGIDINFVIASIDSYLNEQVFIVFGLGDVGDC